MWPFVVLLLVVLLVVFGIVTLWTVRHKGHAEDANLDDW